MVQPSTPRRIVVISDFQDGDGFAPDVPPVEEFERQWRSGERGQPLQHTVNTDDFKVEGGYIERLPLACIKAGLVDTAEVWTHWRNESPPPPDERQAPVMIRRAFQMNAPQPPFSSNDMLGHINAFGAPDILCVWGLGVDEAILSACEKSYKIYNSIDHPALRIPPDASRHFDLIITGAEWQSREVRDRHPDMKTAIMPIGPEFASDTTFYPIDSEKPYDIIYVAAAQAYKRHDILFDALAKLPRSIRTLCVFGYGELSDELRARARNLRIDVDFVGPPGVPFAEVNRLMNLAKIGVVCGVQDGAPAILTEYMLAGLPVLANSELSCGLQYITPQTGLMASAAQFHDGILAMLDRASTLAPRQVVLDHWTWPHTVEKLRLLMRT
ncbi:glycosyltransferase family 4 protein [Rhizobium sp. Leaf262]|uniref:glycosyltransferase family 4 protein n=1 Tax=Rhizobium sp. Leaf262 TaxID=1736312 RepID=UPI000713F6E4|nr:glycosyltransferase family 4 protein [Rhizobium sp. Leaf262]KQO75641.1 glycosyl transferase family 1 [Rhizobium sp. Leaf262]